MNVNSNIKYDGYFKITALTPDGTPCGIWLLKNQLTIINQTMRTQMLLGTYQGGTDILEIKYIAFGLGSTPATINDTELESEIYRKQITQISQPTAGSVQTIVQLGTNECNYNIREIGIFCGPDATEAANTGTLLSRVTVNIQKNTNMVLNIVRTDICNIGG